MQLLFVGHIRDPVVENAKCDIHKVHVFRLLTRSYYMFSRVFVSDQ